MAAARTFSPGGHASACPAGGTRGASSGVKSGSGPDHAGPVRPPGCPEPSAGWAACVLSGLLITVQSQEFLQPCQASGVVGCDVRSLGSKQRHREREKLPADSDEALGGLDRPPRWSGPASSLMRRLEHRHDVEEMLDRCGRVLERVCGRGERPAKNEVIYRMIIHRAAPQHVAVSIPCPRPPLHRARRPTPARHGRVRRASRR